MKSFTFTIMLHFLFHFYTSDTYFLLLLCYDFWVIFKTMTAVFFPSLGRRDSNYPMNHKKKGQSLEGNYKETDQQFLLLLLKTGPKQYKTSVQGLSTHFRPYSKQKKRSHAAVFR